MTDYPCSGCGNLIEESYVIVARVKSVPKFPWVFLHAGELTEGYLDEVCMQIKKDPNSCASRYLDKSKDGDFNNLEVIPFSDIKKIVRGD